MEMPVKCLKNDWIVIAGMMLANLIDEGSTYEFFQIIETNVWLILKWINIYWGSLPSWM